MESDIAKLIDRLEALISAGSRVPLSGKIMLNEQEILEVLDHMRVRIPEEIKQSQRTLQDRERIIGQAQAEAQRIIELAREQADLLLDEKGLVAQAETQRTAIIRLAEEEAKSIRVGADGYAREVLSELEEALSRQLSAVRKGLNELNR
jgi:cell division septum initiation protein DivIVA